MNSSDAVTSATFYRVDGIHFAFGLEWMTAAGNKQSMRQAKDTAVKQGATHLAWRLSKAQVGLTRIEGDVPDRSLLSPWRSAAAAFADLPYSSLLAAFKFRDGRTWVLAATNGRIYAKGDRVFSDEAQARRYFDELFAQQYWNDIFAPAEWQSRAKQIDPLAVLRRKRPEGRIAGFLDGIGATLGVVTRPGTPLTAVAADPKALGRPVIVAAAAGSITLIAGGASYARWHALHSRNAQTAALSPYYPAIAPGDQVLAACLKALPEATRRYQTPGWTLTEATCADRQIAVTLLPDSGTPFTSIVTFHPEADIRSRRQATIQFSLAAGIRERLLVLPLISEDAYQNGFAVADERSNATNVIVPAGPPTGAPPIQNGRQRSRPYKVSSWSFETTAPPLMWEPDLTAIPNLDIASVTLAASDHGMSWRIKGNAYVAP